MTTISPNPNELKMLFTLAAIFAILVFLMASSCKADTVDPFDEVQIEFQEQLTDGMNMYRIYRSKPIDVYYKNPFWDDFYLVTFWCFDASTQREYATIGTGEVCIKKSCVTLE